MLTNFTIKFKSGRNLSSQERWTERKNIPYGKVVQLIYKTSDIFEACNNILRIRDNEKALTHDQTIL